MVRNTKSPRRIWHMGTIMITLKEMDDLLYIFRPPLRYRGKIVSLDHAGGPLFSSPLIRNGITSI
jgi:hypothetical protein